MSGAHKQREDEGPYRVLNDEGEVIDSSRIPEVSDKKLIEMYEDMRLMRRFDKRAISFQRQGRIGTYPSIAGQEGSQIGSAYALGEEDWILPTYRDHGPKYVKGIGLDRIFLEHMGDPRGNEIPDGVNTLPTAIPIATQIPHATGMAWASKLKGESKAFVCYFGDGATSEGDFHEGLNFAGVFDTPTVFFCNNNQWAISVPRERQTASDTIAQKAKAYGFEGVQIDGMDPLAVYKATEIAVEKAKKDEPDGMRPTLIEAVQYRYGAHTTADDPSKYREEEKVKKWREKDPVSRMRNFLYNTGRLDDEKEDAIRDKIEEQVANAIESAEAVRDPDPDEVFTHVYAQTTEGLRQQQEYLRNLVERHGDDLRQE